MHARRLVMIALLFLAGLLIGVGGVSRAGRASQAVAPAQAPSPTLALVAPPNPQAIGKPIDVQITVAGAASLAAFEFDLVYDRTLVQVTSITLRSFLGATTNCNPNTSRCAVALGPLDQTSATSLGAYSYGAGAGATGGGALAVIRLQPTGRGGTTTLQMINPLLADVAANPLTPATQGATLVLPSRLLLPIVRR